MPALQGDDFYDVALAELTLLGYVITLAQRHEPTVIQGTTPKGVAFRYEATATGWSSVVGKRKGSGAHPVAAWWTTLHLQAHVHERVTALGG